MLPKITEKNRLQDVRVVILKQVTIQINLLHIKQTLIRKKGIAHLKKKKRK
jgi:hypothetical protein